jgi:hypothetical protein
VHAHLTSLGAAAAASPGSLEDYVPNSTHHTHFALLYVATAAAAAGTLEDCVMEYGKLCMRIHMGKNQQSVELSSINLETLQREQPPPGATL